MSHLFNAPCAFVAGAATPEQLPKPKHHLKEYAFLGRSNAGKSSLLNALVGHAIAHASKTPGRTRQINFFELKDRAQLVDVPGYGFAKASATERAGWENLIVSYLQNRPTLHRALLLLDARRGVMESDERVLTLLSDFGIPTQLILTKCDKLSAKELTAVQAAVNEATQHFGIASPTALPTSANKKQGISELRAVIAGWVKE